MYTSRTVTLNLPGRAGPGPVYTVIGYFSQLRHSDASLDYQRSQLAFVCKARTLIEGLVAGQSVEIQLLFPNTDPTDDANWVTTDVQTVDGTGMLQEFSWFGVRLRLKEEGVVAGPSTLRVAYCYT